MIYPRVADTKDLPYLIDMSRKFFEASPYASFTEFNEEKLKTVLIEILNVQHLGQAIIFVIDKDSKPVALLIAHIQPLLFADELLPMELAVWVSPEDRSLGYAAILKTGYEYWAKRNGCKLSGMGRLNALDPDNKFEQYLLREGYSPLEQIYVKVL